MKIVMLASLMLLTVRAFAADAPAYDVVCRMRAKEVAAESYRGCVTEARTTQIDKLKKDYQEQLRAMKQQYQADLKRLAAGKKSATNDDASVNRKTGRKKAIIVNRPSPNVVVAGPTNGSEGMDEATITTRPILVPAGNESTMDIPDPQPIESAPSADAGSL